jgi:hypothetical protein
MASTASKTRWWGRKRIPASNNLCCFTAVVAVVRAREGCLLCGSCAYHIGCTLTHCLLRLRHVRPTPLPNANQLPQVAQGPRQGPCACRPTKCTSQQVRGGQLAGVARVVDTYSVVVRPARQTHPPPTPSPLFSQVTCLKSTRTLARVGPRSAQHSRYVAVNWQAWHAWLTPTLS